MSLTESEAKAYLTGVTMASCGFQLAKQSKLPYLLPQIKPDGGTAFRDSLMLGCNLMIELYQVLVKLGTAQTWNFVHVVLTDGDDAASKTSLEDCIKIMYVIGKIINVSALKIIFIGVNVSQKASLQMQTLALAGGENSQYYNVNNTDIEQIFAKIRVNLGIQRKQMVVGIKSEDTTAVFMKEEYNPYLQIEALNYAVLFNLDMSGSMAGSKWNSVCSSVKQFISFLGNRDIVSGIVFNHQPVLIKLDDIQPQQQPPQKQLQYQPPKPAYQPPRPATGYQNNNAYRAPQQRAGRQGQSCKCQIM